MRRNNRKTPRAAAPHFFNKPLEVLSELLDQIAQVIQVFSTPSGALVQYQGLQSNERNGDLPFWTDEDGLYSAAPRVGELDAIDPRGWHSRTSFESEG